MTNYYVKYYASPIGEVLLLASDKGLERIVFKDQDLELTPENWVEQDDPSGILTRTVTCLNTYFKGDIPDWSTISLVAQGSDFQQRVGEALSQIPYGQTVSYGQLADQVGVGSAQAIGGAVKRNPYLILRPCHRVLDSKGNLHGYVAGLDKKKALLDLEGRRKK